MNEDKPKLSANLARGRPARHGGFSFLVTGKLPEHRAYLLSYLTAARAELVRDLGPTENDLTAAQVILIDRIVSMLGVVRCIEEHIRGNSVMVGQNLASPLKESYLTYNNSIARILDKLGIKTKVGEGILDVQEAVTKFDKEKEAEKAEVKKK